MIGFLSHDKHSRNNSSVLENLIEDLNEVTHKRITKKFFFSSRALLILGKWDSGKSRVFDTGLSKHSTITI